MIKKARKMLTWAGLMLVMGFLLAGCGATPPATASGDLTPKQAAELIYHDLVFHDVGVEKVTVTQCLFEDINTAVVDVTYSTHDGKNISQKATLIKLNGQWQIDGHDH
ncbi:DUF4878 domain-containing protein [Desulfitobacterium hafniense]|nr:DUF4878 domain-containing protein [Desulfitobacterium hafniense]ACL20859.1 hypothetical protein Dhaf_2835 [Desulfitobacterium hafniense DCB-2]MEA5025400.1 DUF4878 domain-containing protein [Desulfitobacterium hafniense]CDX01744.1 Prokaryotic membrane lipoprotein lipid attachment site profile [Desulfitobacterium hafniense]